MKKRFTSVLTLCVSTFICINTFGQGLYPPDWQSVVKEDKGDTLVVKGYYETGWFNTLLWAVKADTTANGERTNPNRVYETVPGEYYITDVTLELDTRVPNLHITAPEPPPGVMPPIHVRAQALDQTFDKTFFLVYGNTLMENQYFLHVTINDTYEEREFIRTHAVGSRHEYRNCIFELTAWSQQIPQVNRQTFKFIDCKFINVGHEGTIEKGCVLETRDLPPDTIWMENCTFLNGGILFMALWNTGPLNFYMNHNTIVNVSQPPMSFHTAAEMIVTNNLFVNAGMVADYPDFYQTFGEDDDKMEQGIIDLDTMESAWLSQWYLDENNEPFYPFSSISIDGTDTTFVVDESQRKVLFHKNSVWWDPRFVDMVENQLPAQKPIPPEIGDYEWASQLILMNDRTQAMFDDDESYPYLNEGENLSVEPDFANNEDLVPEWISYVITNSTPGNPNGGDIMPKWRTNKTTNLWMPDWPMLADLSYTNSQLMTGGLREYPLGDLNWFPSKKAAWSNTNEADKLWAALKAGEIPTDIVSNEKQKTRLIVFPNPSANTVNIQFELTGAANVELSVYNLMGQEVMFIDLGYRTHGMHHVTFDKGNLGSGMYLLQISTDSGMAGETAKVFIK